MRLKLIERVFTLRGAKGDVLLKAGEGVEGWYGVMTGVVKLESYLDGGRASAFLSIPAGEWFGEGAAMKPESRRYDVVALRDAELICLPLLEFDELRRSSLEFNHALLSQMNARLGQAMAIIEAGRISSPHQRVALYLSRVFWPGVRKLNLSQEELANLIGLSRQTVDRVLKAFEQMNLVSLEFGRVGILDEAGLIALASH